MNYSVLVRIRTISGSTTSLLEDTKQQILSACWKGLAETVFYRHPDNPGDFYILYHWWSEQAFEAVRKYPSKDFFRNLESRGRVIESSKFQLVWDYRNINERARASTLIVGILPVEAFRKKTIEDLDYLRRERKKSPEIIGLWVGCSVPRGNEPFKTLGRFDFNSGEAQTNFFSSKENLEMLKNIQKGHSQVENASNHMLEFLVSSDVKTDYSLELKTESHPQPKEDCLAGC